MTLTSIHLPNGQSLTVRPVFGGLFFKSNDLNIHSSVFPAGWTIVIQSEDYSDDHPVQQDGDADEPIGAQKRHHHIHRFRDPTLQNDSLFISSISNPSNTDFKPPASPTRQIAMMLWVTLCWYFHQKEPNLHVNTDASKDTPDSGKPKGDWRVYIRREGVFRGRHLFAKLERMGLISSEDSSVGSTTDDSSPEGWKEMFVSRRSFWQLSAKLFLFTLSPVSNPSIPGSPYSSRPSSPVRNSESQRNRSPDYISSQSTGLGLWAPTTPGPFSSGSHLPTYYPPPTLQYKLTNGVRHPLRPKPPRQGEIFYMRHIPSVNQYLTFRVASLSDRPVAYLGPTTSAFAASDLQSTNTFTAISSQLLSTSASSDTPVILEPPDQSEGIPGVDVDTTSMTDIQLLHRWMNNPRVSKFWGCDGPISKQEEFLKANLESQHSFPAIGSWDGKPFGYFEIYWVKEDILGRHLTPGEAEDYDRGVHVLVGEEEFRGQHRLKCWMTSLIHWAFVADYRTSNMVLEPRIDNERFISHLSRIGFSKEKEIAFPHKQSAYMRYRREVFDGPAL